jgi:hypothetical protein
MAVKRGSFSIHAESDNHMMAVSRAIDVCAEGERTQVRVEVALQHLADGADVQGAACNQGCLLSNCSKQSVYDELHTRGAVAEALEGGVEVGEAERDDHRSRRERKLRDGGGGGGGGDDDHVKLISPLGNKEGEPRTTPVVGVLDRSLATVLAMIWAP